MKNLAILQDFLSISKYTVWRKTLCLGYMYPIFILGCQQVLFRFIGGYYEILNN